MSAKASVPKKEEDVALKVIYKSNYCSLTRGVDFPIGGGGLRVDPSGIVGEACLGPHSYLTKELSGVRPSLPDAGHVAH